jgi:small GTP-binding protein
MASSRREISTKLLKLLLLGNSTVGKTSLMLRFCEDAFTLNFSPTIGVGESTHCPLRLRDPAAIRWPGHRAMTCPGLSVSAADYKFKTIEHSGKRVKLQIWDTAGQERFKAITTRYYRMAAGILLVYDITDRATFTNVEGWMQSIHEHGDPNCQVVLIANKVDCAAERVVSTEEGRQCAEKFGTPFFEASARTGDNVEIAFLQLAAAALGSSELFSGDDYGGGGVDLTESEQKAGGGCPC